MHEVKLSEVVRCSRRIVQAAAAFQIGGDAKLDTLCHHRSDGPPLKTYLFELEAEAERFRTYGERIAAALQDVVTAFPGLSLQGRVAILVPDDGFLASLLPELPSALRPAFGARFALISSSDACATLLEQDEGRGGAEAEAIVCDTLANFDGLERLIVFAVGLDAVIDAQGDHIAVLETRSRLYRALTRSHMLAIVVNHALPGGWLEFLGAVRLRKDAAFDREAERRRLDANAAETIMAKRLELIDGALEASGVAAMSELERSYLQGRVAKQASEGAGETEVVEVTDAVVKVWQQEKDALESAMTAVGVQVSSEEAMALHRQLENAFDMVARAEAAEAAVKGVKTKQLVSSAIAAVTGLADEEKKALEGLVKKVEVADKRSAHAAVHAALEEWRQHKAHAQEALQAATASHRIETSDAELGALTVQVAVAMSRGQALEVAIKSALRPKLRDHTKRAIERVGLGLSAQVQEVVVSLVLKTVEGGASMEEAVQSAQGRHAAASAEVHAALEKEQQTHGSIASVDVMGQKDGVLAAVLGGAEVQAAVAASLKELFQSSTIEQTVWDTAANRVEARAASSIAFSPLKLTPADVGETLKTDIEVQERANAPFETLECEFFFVPADKIRKMDKMLRFQEIPAEWFERRRIKLREVLQSAYVEQWLAVSQ